jgi:hypothetical protein
MPPMLSLYFAGMPMLMPSTHPFQRHAYRQNDAR